MKKLIFLFALFFCYLAGDGQIIYRSSDYLFKNRVSVGAQSETATPTSVWFRIGDSASNKAFVTPTAQQRDSVADNGPLLRGMQVWDLFESKPYWYDGSNWITFTNEGDTIYLVNGAPTTADSILYPTETEMVFKSFKVDSTHVGLISSGVTDSTFGVGLDSSVLFPLIRATIPGGVSYTFENGVFDAGGNVIKADTTVLVTWAFRQKLADSLASIILAANGLQKVSGVIELGGALTKNTTVTPSTFELNVATNSLGTTQSNASGINLTNSTEAAAGAQQISPAIRFRGNGWKTSGAGSQTVDVRNYLLPVQGTTSPTASMVWEYSYNGGAYSDLFKVTSLGFQHIGSGSGGGLSFSSTAPAAQAILSVSSLNFGVTSTAANNTYAYSVSTGYQQTSGTTKTFTINNGSLSTGFYPTSGTATNTVLSIEPFINQTGGASGISRGIHIDATLTAAADYRALDIEDGTIYLNNTVTAGGVTGNQTINKASGTVNFAAGATSLTVTNSWVTASSIVLAVVRTNDATAYIKNVVCSAGSFVITLGAAATAETSVGFVVFNK